MSNMTRSIKRGILFNRMNKQQKKLWSSMKPVEKRDYENEKGKEIKEQILQKRMLRRRIRKKIKVYNGEFVKK